MTGTLLAESVAQLLLADVLDDCESVVGSTSSCDSNDRGRGLCWLAIRPRKLVGLLLTELEGTAPIVAPRGLPLIVPLGPKATSEIASPVVGSLSELALAMDPVRGREGKPLESNGDSSEPLLPLLSALIGARLLSFGC